MIHRHAHNACFSTRPGRSSACRDRDNCCFLKRFPGGKPLTVPAPHRRAAARLAALTRAESPPRMWELIASHDLPQPWGWESVPKWKGPRVQGPGVPLLEGNGGLLCAEPAEETSDLHAMLVTLEAKQKDTPYVSGRGEAGSYLSPTRLWDWVGSLRPSAPVPAITGHEDIHPHLLHHPYHKMPHHSPHLLVALGKQSTPQTTQG